MNEGFFLGFLQTFHAVNQYSIVSNGKGMLKCNIYSQSSYTSETHGISGAHVWTLRKSTKRKSQCLTPISEHQHST